MDKWLKVSLTVDGELAEAVAEVLARFVPGGVAIEATAIAVNFEDEGGPIGPWQVYGFLPVDKRLVETRQQLEEALWFLGRISPLPDPQFEYIEEVNWVESWKQHYHPTPVGQKLLIVPSWLDPSTDDRLPVRIDPGMAFGTGTHPTTQLCLEMLESAVLEAMAPPEAMIDVGCGSGILGIAALKLGVGRALGVDTDPEAIRDARKNAALNQGADRLDLGAGSVKEILAGAYSIQQAPLVVANILAPVLVRMLDDGLGELLTPSGTLILSGILEEQEAQVVEALYIHGLSLRRRRQAGDWVALDAGY